MSKIVMTHSVVGFDNKEGTSSRKYLIGEILPTTRKWQKELAHEMIERGAAMEVQGNNEPSEIKRARTDSGKLMADDPSTPDVNEAWEGGVAPKKKLGRPPKNKVA